MIRAEHITKSFDGRVVLDDISIEFLTGKTNLIIGRSGSGKTVLLKTLVGLHEPDSGDVWYDDTNFTRLDFRERRAIRKDIGMIFQGGALLDSSTVEENVKLPLDLFTSQSEKEKMERAKAVCQDGPILTLKPLHKKKVAILTTGSEVYHGRIEDKFTPVLVEKLKEYDCEMIFHEAYDDDHEAITKGCLQAIEQGAELVLCTGGMSVDPDDRTPLAIKNACTEVVTYGAPVLPGAMFMLAYCEKEGRQIPVMGLPGCVMYAKRTIFDLVLPRIMCDEKLHEKDFRLLGQGGLCLSCPVCTFPNCGFGKGGY